MQFSAGAALAAIAALFCAAAAPPPSQLRYSLSPVLEGGTLRAIEVEADFRGDADGKTMLRLPDRWGGQEELWRAISDLRVVSGAEMTTGEGPAQRVLSHRPDAAIRIAYRIIQDRPGPPMSADGNAYRPIIQPSYFHVIGNAIIVAPQRNDDTPVRVRLRNQPHGWSFASDLEHPGLTLGELRRSVSVGGDFRVLRGAQERDIRIAIRGEWPFDDADFVREVEAILAGQRRFWGDHAEPYLVTVLQLGETPGVYSLGGTGLGDSFAFFATPSIERARITRTLAHEGLHTWIPGRVGGMPPRDEAAGYWFSEGFTDFFTGRLLVRDGLWGPPEFAADLNEMLRAYAGSSARTAPNARIVQAFWSDRDVEALPYQRGRLLAILWDARLRARGARDLDDVLLEMKRRAQGASMHAPDLFTAAMREIGAPVNDDVAAFIERGEPILLTEEIFAPCGRIVTRDVPVFSRGFDVEATIANDNVVAGVDPESPAHAAGLRNGMRLVRREGGVVGDSEQEIAYRVVDNGAERLIRYLPQGRQRTSVQRFDLDGTLSGERLAVCLRVLGGM